MLTEHFMQQFSVTSHTYNAYRTVDGQYYTMHIII